MGIVNINQLDYDEITVVSQHSFNDKNRPEVRNRIRKALFFLWREGSLKTYRKIQSKKMDGLSETKFYTLIKILKDNHLYGNLSIQFTQDTNDFIIQNHFFESDNQMELSDFLVDTHQFNQFVSGPVPNSISLHESPKIDNGSKNHETGVFLYGLGDYSRVYIAPQIKSLEKICCVDYNRNLSLYYQKTFKFENERIVPQDSYSLLSKTQYPLAIIATYHSDHARLAKEMFEINPSTFLFIEKPPCVNLDDLDNLLDLYSRGARIEIGYNRRYIPINLEIRKLYRNKVKVINISVKEIKIKGNHWYFWKNQGTRITGNLTHWIDLATFWIDEKPLEMTMLPSLVEDETIGLSILYDKGSLVNISVSDKGNSIKGVQEIIEIRTGEDTILVNDYTSSTRLNATGKSFKSKFIRRDKGHERMYKNLIKTYKERYEVKYPQKDLIYTTIITFFAAKMLREDIRHIELSNEINRYLKN